jgi:hypothetical protein
VAADGAEGADATLALEAQHALVEAARQEEGAIEAPEILGGNRRLEGLVDVTLRVDDGQMLD